MKLILLLLLFCQAPWAKTEKERSFASHLHFDFGLLNANILHEEASNDVTFSALNEDTNIAIHLVGLGYEYELFAASLMSLTLHTSVGAQMGQDSKYDEGESGQFDMEGTVSGFYGAGGLSLNLNTHKGYQKIQYFIGARSIKGSSIYFLRYDDTTDSDRSTEIEYSIEQSILETSIGVRLFKYGKKNIYSIISLSRFDFTTDTLSVDASRGETSYELSQNARFKYQDYSLRIGFGLLF